MFFLGSVCIDASYQACRYTHHCCVGVDITGVLRQLCVLDGGMSVAARELKRRNLRSCNIPVWIMARVLQVL